MTVELYDAVGGDGLFNVLGKAFHAFDTLNTARLTTVPTEVIDAINQHQLLTATAATEQAISQLPSGLTGWQASGNGLSSSLAAYCSNLTIALVNADTPLPSLRLYDALVELIAQMTAASQSVDAPTVSVAATADAGNAGNGVLALSVKREDGRTTENAIPEDIAVVAASATGLRFTGEAAASLLSEQWPAGSGCAAGVTATSPSGGLLSNGGFETEADLDNAPDDWIVSVGTVATNIKMTDVEVQTVAITGTPTGGYYRLKYTDTSSRVQATTNLAYNASAATVQAALRQLDGLTSVTVTATGTSPNYTHTVTFAGLGGNITVLSSDNLLTGGTSPTITHGTTTAGSSQVFSGGKAMILNSAGSVLCSLNQQISLQPSTCYAVNLWACSDVQPAAGELRIELIDGIGGTVITDDQVTANQIVVNAANVTTSFQSLGTLAAAETYFRTPREMPPVVYLRIRVSTAVTAGSQIFLDSMALVKANALYAGGPFVAAFAGNVAFAVNDQFTVAVANNRAGAIQEACNRFFNMTSLGLLLPSNAAGAETIPDSVIG